MTSKRKNWKSLAVAFIFLWFLVGAIAHFVMPGVFMSAMPDYLPLYREAVLVGGFFELLGLWLIVQVY